MLSKEFHHYIKNQDDYVSKYGGRYLVIVGNELVGVYDSAIEAYEDSKDKYELGHFFIQHCAPGPSNYTHTLHVGITAS